MVALPEPGAGAAVRESRLASYTPKHLADKILKERSTLEGERRQVTVLFADLAGFTSLAEQRDPEEVHELIDRCFDVMTTEVHRFEGTVNQYTGDGIMALFGAPIAHEDSPRRAVHAALGIQRALREYSRALQERKGPALQMRVGINTGPVVVGRIGDDLRMDYTAVGDTTNLAARLQQIARPGSVLVGEATHKLIAGYFETLAMGELTVKGHTPVRAFEVLRPRGRRARLDVAAERGLTPLVGRERELETLGALFREVKAGRGQVVSIAGEAGIGKSRLLLEFRSAVAGAGEHATWLEGRCVSFGQSIPFLPVIDQFRENFRIEEFDGEPEIIAKVEHGLRGLGQVDGHIPYVRYLLAVDPGDPAIAAMDASARRKRILEACRGVALRGASLRPILFVIEDLHWVDTSTEEFLAFLIDAVANAPIMLLLTYRGGYTPPFGGRSFCTTLTLRSLSEPETLTMAGRVLGTAQFPPELMSALMEKAEGVPLFVEEVTKTLIDLGVLRQENGGYRVVKGVREVNVPDTMQAIIMARLDRLGEGGKRTVQLASVIGRQFLRRLLERITELPGQLEGLLAELKTLEIIYEQGLVPEPAYIFKHAVIQDVAYNSLLMQRRKELHREVGRAIEELYPDRLAEHYEELAHHFALGEESGKAVTYSLLAGDRAAHAFANHEARRHYARGLDVAERETAHVEAGLLARLHAKHAAVLSILAEYDAAVAEYRRALELVRPLGDRNREIEILVALSGVYYWGHNAESARQAANEALAIAREVGDRAAEAGCLGMRAETAVADGTLIQATADIEEALRLSHEIGEPRLRAQILTSAGRVLQFRGEFDRAIAYLREGVQLARQEYLGDFLGLALYVLGHAHLAKGAYEDALRWYQELGEYAEAAGDKLYIVRVPNCLAGVYLDVYDLAAAIRLNEEGDDVAKRLWRWPEPRGHSLVKLALAHLYRDDHARAQAALGRARELLELDTWGRFTWEIPFLRACGELELAEGRPEEAWRYATASLTMAAQCGRPKHMVRAQQLQADTLAAWGKLEEALDPLIASIRLAETIGTPRERWTGKRALGNLFVRLGRDRDAERQYVDAAQTIEALASKLATPGFRRSFLEADPVQDVYRALGRRAPQSLQ